MNFIVFLFVVSFLFVVASHLFLTLADQFSHPMAIAGSEELNPSFLGRRLSALATGGIAAIITLFLILVFNARKQAAPTEGYQSGHRPSPEVLRCFSFNEIVSATESSSSSSFIRRQGVGHVSKGFIDDGKQRVVMIRLASNLWNEVKALSKLRHDNLVSLIGYCNESPHMILVYESMPLRTSLFDTLQTNSASLSWHQRLKICIGAARGLDYLHTSMDGGITHGDFKSSDILLDENYKPKIVDFGLLSDSSQKSDVYSFGIVLLEVLCGNTSENSRDQLINWAKSLIGDGQYNRMVDPRLNGQISSECLIEFVLILRKCLHDDPKRRPTMVQVVARLELLSDNNVNVCGESSATEPSHKKTESMSCDLIRQSVLWTKFAAATQDFNQIELWYDGAAYKIYGGTDIFGRTRPYIIYRGKYIPDDISNLAKLLNLSHPNLASLEGYCCKYNETIVGYKNEGLSLLYEYQCSYNLPWHARLKICIGVAEAVKRIHAAKIIHGGICHTTIFVDSSYCAKLATFGTVSRSWSAYYNGLPLPPDIAGSAKMTEKTDVYLFGLILLIVFCGKKMDFSWGYPFLLHNNFIEAMQQRNLCNITDMNILDQRIVYSLDEYLKVAFGCCSLEQSNRPSMDTVVKGLKKAQDLLA